MCLRSPPHTVSVCAKCVTKPTKHKRQTQACAALSAPVANVQGVLHGLSHLLLLGLLQRHT